MAGDARWRSAQPLMIWHKPSPRCDGGWAHAGRHGAVGGGGERRPSSDAQQADDRAPRALIQQHVRRRIGELEVEGRRKDAAAPSAAGGEGQGADGNTVRGGR